MIDELDYEQTTHMITDALDLFEDVGAREARKFMLEYLRPDDWRDLVPQGKTLNTGIFLQAWRNVFELLAAGQYRWPPKEGDK